MRAFVVLNAAAGSLEKRPPDQVVAEVTKLFSDLGVEAEVVAETGAAIGEAIERGIKSDAEVIIVGGGDGTVTNAAGPISKAGKTLGIIPLGTLNLVARDLGIPLTIPEAIAALAKAETRTIDLAEVNDRIFLSNSGLGFFARMAVERERQRRRWHFGKWHTFMRSLYYALRQPDRMNILVDYGKGPQHFRARGLLVTNNALGEAGLLLGRPVLDAGELVLHISKHRSMWGMIRTGFKMALGTWQADQEVEIIRAHSIEVKRRHRHVWATTDGEIWRAKTPIKYVIRPRALKVLSPKMAVAADAGTLTEPAAA